MFTDLEMQLEHSMQSLIRVMRLFLDNLQEERQAIIHGQANAVKVILQQRAFLLDQMADQRQKMTCTMQKIQPEVDVESLINSLGAEHVSLLALRDQILALSEGIEKQNHRNSHLVSNLPQLSPNLSKKVSLLTLDE